MSLSRHEYAPHNAEVENNSSGRCCTALMGLTSAAT
jgi:hypothetical protein